MLATETEDEASGRTREDDWSFRPYPRLENGHLQTIAGALWRRRHDARLDRAESRLVAVEEESRVLLRCSWLADAASRPTLLLVHGLEGSTESGYILGTASKALAAGLNVVRLNIRNCGGTEHLSPTLYNSGMSSDVARVLEHLVEVEKLDRIAVAGFSLGANLVLKMAGEYGAAAPPALRAIATVSPALDLAAAATALERRSNLLYQRRFVRSLRRRMLRKDALFPGRYDVTRLRGMRSVRDYDNRYVAPLFGYRDAEDYYERASAVPYLGLIHVPTLLIHALDDPFIPLTDRVVAAVRSNPRARLIATERGGHVGFVGADRPGEDRHWSENRVVEFVLAETGEAWRR